MLKRLLQLKASEILLMAAAAAAVGVGVAGAARAITSIGTDISTDGALTVNGDVSMNDDGADALLIGQNGATPDTVQIAGNVSLADSQWSVSAAGAASLASLIIGNGAGLSKHLSVAQTNATSSSISAASCGNYATVTVTGAAVGDTVVASPSPATNGIEDVNLAWNAYVSAADTVVIRACNPQALTAIDTDNTQTWRLDVWQH